MTGAGGELLLIIGPPAVGKMTVGRAVCARSDFRLFHNHHTIEPLLEVFGYGTPAFEVLNLEFRRRVIEEAARHATRLVFTFVWGVDLPQDATYVRSLVAPYVGRGLRVSVAELSTDLPTRLVRNATPERLTHKPSKRDLAWSEDNVRTMDAEHRMTTDPDRPSLADPVIAELPGGHLRLDTTDLSVDAAAHRILDWLDEI